MNTADKRIAVSPVTHTTVTALPDILNLRRKSRSSSTGAGSSKGPLFSCPPSPLEDEQALNVDLFHSATTFAPANPHLLYGQPDPPTHKPNLILTEATSPIASPPIPNASSLNRAPLEAIPHRLLKQRSAALRSSITSSQSASEEEAPFGQNGRPVRKAARKSSNPLDSTPRALNNDRPGVSISARKASMPMTLSL